MQIFKTISRSVTDPSLYADAEKIPFRKYVRFYAKFALFMGLIAALVGAIFFSPFVGIFMEKAQNEILATYPQGLEITVKDGVVSTNAPTEPLYIEYTPTMKEYISAKAPAHFVVIDTKNPVSPTVDYFRSLNSEFLISQHDILYYGKGDQIVTEPLSNFPNITINQSFLVFLFGKASFIPFLIPFGAFVFAFLSVFLTLFTLVGAALIFYVLQKILKKEFTYSESWKICVFASLVPVILGFIFFFVGFRPTFVFTLLTLIIALINTKHEPHTEHIPGIEE